MTSSPHNLALYVRAVQSPWATAALLERMYRRAQQEHRPGRAVRVRQASERADNTRVPALLREDFAGSCALAAAWVAGGGHRRALCVDNDAATLRWAERYVREMLVMNAGTGERADDLHLVCADVMHVGVATRAAEAPSRQGGASPRGDVPSPGDAPAAQIRLASTTRRGTRRFLGTQDAPPCRDGASDSRVAAPHIIAPRVDVIAALNFSALIYHDEGAMLRYLCHARANLRPGGVFVMDVFSAPHACGRTLQTRRIPAGEGLPAFTYQWEQRAFDAETRRIDCRIHFGLRTGKRATRASAGSRTDTASHSPAASRAMRWRRNAFRYDWTLWPPETLVAFMREAGFSRASVWCDRVNPATGLADGVFRSVKAIGERADYLAYIVGLR